MKKNMLFYMILISTMLANAQESTPLDLQYLYTKLNDHYPIATKYEVQQQITILSQELTQSGWYPEVMLGASTTYQSEVTEVTFAPSAPEFSKDHYTISLDVTQPIFEAGRISKMKQLDEIQGQTMEARFEIEMNQLRFQLDQFYFGILNARKQLEILEVLEETLHEQLQLVESLVTNGVQLPGNQYVLEAEILKLQQKQLAVNVLITSSFKALEIITGIEIEHNSTLKIPETLPIPSVKLNRPEFEWYNFQQKVLSTQMDLKDSNKLPVFSAFGKTAYGRPGFNAFNDDLHFYWMFGVKAQWSFRNWRNSNKESQIFELQKDQIVADQNAFSLQLETSIAKKLEQIQTLEDQIDLDEQVLILRSKVVQEKKKQLEEGIITSTELITELNAESNARLDLELHALELVQANYELLRLKGNVWY